jgi:hypothetical protein
MVSALHASKRKKPPEVSSCLKALEKGQITLVAPMQPQAVFFLHSFNSATGFSKRRDYQLTIPGPCLMQE